MLFNSFHYFFFLLLVIPVTWVLSDSVKWRNRFLLVASFYFYACWDWRFLGLIFVSTLINFLCGLSLGKVNQAVVNKAENICRRRTILAISVITSLGILGYFKYFNFFVASAATLLESVGLQANDLTLQIILPIGISFYTFQALSYTIDVYRMKVEVERNFVTFALYVVFFPQLVAGPIERAQHFLPQLNRRIKIKGETVYYGVYLILWGLFKKTVIADNLAPIANASFGAEATSGLWVLFGVYTFAIQIYCDFSGYSDIARGTAKCMGFDLILNFNLPYFSKNPKEFWARWHISLSTWLRDYLYIPLGGNRHGSLRTYFNLMTTMMLGGLWHGAAWNFVIWGGYQGGLLCAHRFLAPWLSRFVPLKIKALEIVWSISRWFVFFHLVCFGWLLFRADSLQTISKMTTALFTNFLGQAPGWVSFDKLMIFGACGLALFLVQAVQNFTKDLSCVYRLPLRVRGLVYCSLLGGIVIFGNIGSNEFIYFQF